MAASIRNSKLRGVRIGIEAGPPPPAGITVRTQFVEMTYATQYQTAYPSATQIGGTFDSSTYGGTGGVLTNSDKTFEVTSAPRSILGTAAVAPWSTWEFLINDSTYIVGLWVQAFGGPYDPTFSTGSGGDFASWMAADGSINGYAGGSGGASFTNGDVIGCVFNNFNVLHFFKNGTEVGQGNLYDNVGFLVAGKP